MKKPQTKHTIYLWSLKRGTDVGVMAAKLTVEEFGLPKKDLAEGSKSVNVAKW